ncbi:MAG: hypothetical protein MI824_26920 [Hyphomicrobiales bacterium]|nr:hypothetical protein [Hyphomicrobiales bacterium]
MAKPKNVEASAAEEPAIAAAADSGLLADDAMDEILIGLDSLTRSDQGFTLARDLTVADLIADEDQPPEIDLTQILGPEAPEPAAEAAAQAETEEGGPVDVTIGFGPTAVAILVDDDGADGGVTI